GGIDGMMLVLKLDNTHRVITIKDGTGNITLSGSDFLLTDPEDRIMLMYDSGINKWCEISRSDNKA
ncbi:unnamed protein product, partial [marine sediment metagenome]